MSAAPTVVVEPVFVEEGDNFRVTPDVTDRIQPARAAPLEGGGYVVTWVSSSSGNSPDERVYAQLFGADDTALGAAFEVAPDLDFWQRSPSVVALAGGGFLIGFSTLENSTTQVLAQRYDATGQSSGDLITIAAFGGAPLAPTVTDFTALPDGGFLATWNTYNGPGGTDEINARLYDAAGAPLDAAFPVNTHTADSQNLPDTAVLADGIFVVVWQSIGQDGSGSGIYGQMFSAAGSPVGSEFRVNTVTAGGQTSPRVAALEDGGFVVSWEQPDIFSPTVVKAQVYDAAGAAVGGEIIVDSFNTAAPNPGPVVAGLPDGGFVIAWHKDFDDIRAQSYEADGTPRGTTFDVSTSTPGVFYYRGMQDVIVTDDGELMVFWHSAQNPNANDSDILAQSYLLENRATEQESAPLYNRIVVGDDGIGSNVVTVTLSVDYGQLTVATGGSGVGASGNGTASVVLTGTVDQLNALLTGGAGSAVSYLAHTDVPPSAATLTVEVRDGENQTDTATAAVTILAVDDPAVALPDAASTTEAATKSGNLLADNGSGADHDPDGPALVVAAVNGSAVAIGSTITLASGALLTVQSNGDYLYDPNGQFDALPAAGSGASNLTAQDSFTYTLANGGTATVTLTITGLDTDDTLLGTAGNDTLNAGNGNDTLDAGAGDDTLNGGNQDDRLIAEAGHDTVDGGAGTDVLVLDWSDSTNDIASDQLAGWTSAGSAGLHTDGAGRSVAFNNIEFVEFTTGSGNDNLMVGAGTVSTGDGSDMILGWGGPLDLDAGPGNDLYWSGEEADIYDGGAGQDWIRFEYLSGGVTVTLDSPGSGTSSDGDVFQNIEFVEGSTFADTLNGSEGGDILGGGAGADAVYGNGGDDSLWGGVDNDAVHGGNGDDQLFGETGTDSLYGGDGADRLDGGTGSDSLTGGSGNDVYVVDDAGDQVVEQASGGYDTVLASLSYTLGADVERLRALDPAASVGITLTGNALANEIDGDAGANVIDGRAGADVMSGFGGNDVYFVDNAGDQLIEIAGGGYDTVFASVSHTLGTQLDRLVTADPGSTSALSLTGNGLANEITGNAGANLIDGGAGADLMSGAGGDDIYFVDNAADVVSEGPGAGYDTVFSTVSFTISSLVERLVAYDPSSTAALSFTGSSVANEISGNAGANVIDGGAGADFMSGLGGNDVYFVDNAADQIVELSGGGYDTVFTTVSYTIGAEVERLVTADPGSSAALNLTGNASANELTGNAGVNWLDGGAGADLMSGAGGDDIYFVDNAGDVVSEGPGGGYDTVFATVSFTIDSLVERLVAYDPSSTTALDFTGSAVANELSANNGANVIDGGAGADLMMGLGGNDVYFIDDAGDQIVELGGGGYDTVFASRSYTLGSEVERLVALNPGSTDALSFTGNALANEISGNAGGNLIDGAAGADVLAGNGGDDAFMFSSALGGGNVDTLLDFAPSGDRIYLDDAVFTGLAQGTLSANAFHTGAAAADADDRIIYDPATGALYFDADGTGAGAAIQFAALRDGLSLAASDFAII